VKGTELGALTDNSSAKTTKSNLCLKTQISFEGVNQGLEPLGYAIQANKVTQLLQLQEISIIMRPKLERMTSRRQGAQISSASVFITDTPT
jgi:hypothetical protein